MPDPVGKHYDTQKNPAELLQDLIRFDTTNPPGNEAACIQYIEKVLSGTGMVTNILAKDVNRPNLVARLRGRGDKPPLLIYGHIDVVTALNQKWSCPPFEGRREDGYVWGRGALDMKGGVAMMLAAILRICESDIKPSGDIIFAALSDEEAGGSLGAGYLVENHADYFSDTQYAIGEFGGFSMYVGNRCFYPVMVAEKQACWIKCRIKGPAGHGSIPVRGGAMASLGQMLSMLDKHRLPVHITPVVRRMIETMAGHLGFPQGFLLRGLLQPSITDLILKLLGEKVGSFDPLLHHTVNATIVNGGEKVNVIPSEIEVQMDGRILPGFSPDDFLAELKHIVGSDIEFEIEHYDAFHGEPDMGLFGTLASILKEVDPDGIPLPMMLPGVTDGRLFARLGIQTYGFLPMKLPPEFNFSKLIHAADERIPEDALTFGADSIYKLIERY